MTSSVHTRSLAATLLVVTGTILASFASAGCSSGGPTILSFSDELGRRCTYDCTKGVCSAYICTPDPAPAMVCEEALASSRRCYVLGYGDPTNHVVGLCDACCAFGGDAGVKETHSAAQCSPLVCKVGSDCPLDGSLCLGGRCVLN